MKIINAFIVFADLDEETEAFAIRDEAYEFEGTVWELLVEVGSSDYCFVYVLDELDVLADMLHRDKTEIFSRLDPELQDELGSPSAIPDNVFYPFPEDDCIEFVSFSLRKADIHLYGKFKQLVRVSCLIESVIDIEHEKFCVKCHWHRNYKVVPREELEDLGSLEEFAVLLGKTLE